METRKLATKISTIFDNAKQMNMNKIPFLVFLKTPLFNQTLMSFFFFFVHKDRGSDTVESTGTEEDIVVCLLQFILEVVEHVC